MANQKIDVQASLAQDEAERQLYGDELAAIRAYEEEERKKYPKQALDKLLKKVNNKKSLQKKGGKYYSRRRKRRKKKRTRRRRKRRTMRRRKRRTMRRRKRRTMRRRKRGGKTCPPPDKGWYKKVGNCVQIRKTATGRTYKVSYPDDEACCPNDNYVCRIEGRGDEREPVCHFVPPPQDNANLKAEPVISPALAEIMKDLPRLDERQLLPSSSQQLG